MKKFFENISTLDELKAAYRRLAMQFHPDRGGDVEIMQSINAEYEKLHEVLKNAHNAAADEFHKTTECAAEFIDIINALMKLNGLVVELCGSWLWISGETRQHKDELKKLGCRWSSKKSLWYWRHEEDGRSWSRGRSTMSEIRFKYGSQVFSGQHEYSAAERIGA